MAGGFQKFLGGIERNQWHEIVNISTNLEKVTVLGDRICKAKVV